ncbi:hypothetical protein KCH_14860 [Kitasatospora cheerisanensis KCTC 2395]|uniref:Uncharacterized protein n=1 Tax=Kitasatospora cheerisanensis KCTC 2395 TaxID=1348663 RepID=A0A066YZV9_9ACTN|nr:hypothetical protein KCH_14860 [Kitasatospora cheerisanensis KCTC 2395]
MSSVASPGAQPPPPHIAAAYGKRSPGTPGKRFPNASAGPNSKGAPSASPTADPSTARPPCPAAACRLLPRRRPATTTPSDSLGAR